MSKPKPHPLDALDPHELGDMVCTRAALKAYDAANGKLRAAIWSWRRRRQPTEEIIEELRDEVSRRERELGESFAQDTTGKLDSTIAKAQKPCPRLRALLRNLSGENCEEPQQPRNKPRGEPRVVKGDPFVLPTTKSYLLLRADAMEKARKLAPLLRMNATTDRRHERDTCPKYDTCRRTASLNNWPCLPCGMKAKGKRTGCPLLPS